MIQIINKKPRFSAAPDENKIKQILGEKWEEAYIQQFNAAAEELVEGRFKINPKEIFKKLNRLTKIS